MALPPPLRLPQHLRLDPRPQRRLLADRPPRPRAPPSAAATSPGTNVLETTWMTGSGWVIVRDVLTLGDWRPDNDFEPHRRPPPDDEAEHVLVRMVECLQGEVDIEMICQPAFDYGATRVDWQRRGDVGDRRRGDPRRHPPDPDRRPRPRRRRLRRPRPPPDEGRRGPVQRAQLGPLADSARLERGLPAAPASARSTSGAAGSRAAASRTTPGATPCSARPSSSRA